MFMPRKNRKKIRFFFTTLPSKINRMVVKTLLVIVKDQSSHLVYLNICIKQQTCENLSSIGRRSWEIIMKAKTPLSHEVLCFQMRWINSRPQNLILRSRNQIRRENYFFLENYVTSEGAVSHNVLYINLSPLIKYQVRFYAYNYFK